MGHTRSRDEVSVSDQEIEQLKIAATEARLQMEKAKTVALTAKAALETAQHEYARQDRAVSKEITMAFHPDAVAMVTALASATAKLRLAEMRHDQAATAESAATRAADETMSALAGLLQR